ncbi:hypothetical protein ACET3Z_027408 [Daucus carota]
MAGSSSSSAPPSQSPASGASKFLANLPNRGLLSSSTVYSTNPGGMRVYICEHDTSPPEDQLIKTNQTNILIRSLVLKKRKVDSNSKDGKAVSVAESSRKRAPERTLEGRTSSKRGVSNTHSQPEGSRSRAPEKDLQSLTVERLRAILREKGLSAKGKKDELIARLRAANG